MSVCANTHTHTLGRGHFLVSAIIPKPLWVSTVSTLLDLLVVIIKREMGIRIWGTVSCGGKGMPQWAHVERGIPSP